MGFAAFADAPVDVAVVEVGMGGAWDSTNVADGRVAVVTPIALDHTAYLGDTPGQDRGGEGGDHQARRRSPCSPRSRRRPRTCCCGGRPRSAPPWPGRAPSSASPARAVAVGGQVLTLQGLGGVYDELFLPLHGAHQAQNAAVALAAVEAFLGAGADTGVIDVEVVREALLGVSSPGRLEALRSAPTVLVDAAHNPHGMAATRGRAAGVVLVPPADRRGRRARPTRTSPACSPRWSRCSTRWW